MAVRQGEAIAPAACGPAGLARPAALSCDATRRWAHCAAPTHQDGPLERQPRTAAVDLFTDRDHIVRWAWRTRHENAQRVAAAVTSREDLSVVRLRRQREVDQWLAGPLRDSVRPDSNTGHTS